MEWYKNTGADLDVVISSRVRMARNIADYPFASRLDKAPAEEIVQKIKEAASDSLNFIDFTKITPAEAASYAEKHYVSPEFVSSDLPRALLLDTETGVAIMVIEEDHIRLQCIKAGLALGEAYETACIHDDILCDNLNIAYDEKLGFLTHCPTNLGCAMRASAMLFLPALTSSNKIKQLAAYLPKIGVAMRGIYGEGSGADGCMYQVSNQKTLGASEAETLERLTEIICQIVAMERGERVSQKNTSGDKMEDTAYRALGILKHARLMSSAEFMKLLADLRLGVAMGYINDLPYEKLSDLMISAGGAGERGRAAFLQKSLAKNF